MKEPTIHFSNPFKERVLFTGMPQEGKSNALAYFLSITRNPWIMFNTLNLPLFNNLPRLNPRMQRVISPHSEAERLPLFKKICRAAYLQGNVLFAVDEAHEFCTKYEIEPEHKTLLLEGGNRNVGHFAATQSIADINNKIIRSSRHHLIFRTFMPQDVDWYGKFVPKDYILMSKDLPQYWFIYYRLGGTPQIMKPLKKMGD